MIPWINQTIMLVRLILLGGLPLLCLSVAMGQSLEFDSSRVLLSQDSYNYEVSDSGEAGMILLATQAGELLGMVNSRFGKTRMVSIDAQKLQSTQVAFLQDYRIEDAVTEGEDIYVSGYNYDKEKGFVANISSTGEIRWEVNVSNGYTSSINAISINGKHVYGLGESEPAQFPISISFSKGWKNILRWRGLRSDGFRNKVFIVKISREGEKQVNKKLTNSAGVRFAGKIASTETNVCINYIEDCFGKSSTSIYRLFTGDRLKQTKRIETIDQDCARILCDHNGDFIGVESSMRAEQFVVDSLTFRRINPVTGSITVKSIPSVFDEIDLAAAGWNSDSTLIFSTGNGFNMKSPGIIWATHRDTYFSSYSLGTESMKEYYFPLSNTIDQSNSMAQFGGKHYAYLYGEFWGGDDNNIMIKPMIVKLNLLELELR